MPFFSPKTWKQRIVEFPGRRRLDDTSSADVYDVSRAEGTVTQEGDGFTAANMNDLEQRINNAVNDVAGLSADEYDPNATYSSGDLRIHDNILHKAKQDISVAEAWTPDHWDPTTLAAELSAVNSRGALTVLYSTSTEITNPANQITLLDSIGNFRRLIFFFGYANTGSAATPIEIPVELFKTGFAATYSFANAQRNCWGQATYINDNTVSLIGADNQYTPYLLAVYGVS